MEGKIREIDTVIYRVKEMLIEFEKSRNDDASLVANYWFNYEKKYMITIEDKEGNNMTCLPLRNYHRVTSASVIERARRLVQEDCEKMPETTDAEKFLKVDTMKKYMPTDLKVMKRRKLSSVLWKNYINEHAIERVMKIEAETQIEGDNNNNDSRSNVPTDN